jgi:anti-sigma regulatory factor (Ser/Thr protein kinase)
MLLANDIQEVARVIDRIELFCFEENINPQQGLRFSLALDELITNVLSYGLAGRSDGEITLFVRYEHDALHAEISDNGPPFDPFSQDLQPPKGSIEERTVGGLGIALVKAVMDKCEYRRDGAINRLNIAMKLSANEPPKRECEN